MCTQLYFLHVTAWIKVHVSNSFWFDPIFTFKDDVQEERGDSLKTDFRKGSVAFGNKSDSEEGLPKCDISP